MLGVVGRSGSGKSTLTRLLQGINREYSGFLKLDGVELREINLTHLRSSFGVVLQDNFLFRGTVRDNITAGRPGLTLDDVVRAARLAGAEEFIERLPSGYETWIEEGSSNLSGGQRQRLAIARAVIADPKLMILDEATSALDPESEALVNANLVRLGKGRTMVIVSHRLSSLIDCDQILVMDKGQVLDVAPHRTLLERCSVYRTLWAQQNRHLDVPAPKQASVVPVSQPWRRLGRCRASKEISDEFDRERRPRRDGASVAAGIPLADRRAHARAGAVCRARRDLDGLDPGGRLHRGVGPDPDRQGRLRPGADRGQGVDHRRAAARSRDRAHDRRA